MMRRLTFSMANLDVSKIEDSESRVIGGNLCGHSVESPSSVVANGACHV